MKNLLHKNTYNLLLESTLGTVGQDDFIKIYNHNCSQHSLDNTPLYKGIPNIDTDYLLVRPSIGNATYTNILIDSYNDWSRFPKRTHSIICSTNRNDSAVNGTLYILLPFDNTDFAYAPCPTFEDCFDSINKYFTSLRGFNLFIEQLNGWHPLTAKNFNQLRDSINNLVDNAIKNPNAYNLSDGQMKFIELCKRTGKKATEILEIYTHPIKNGFKTIKYSKKFNLRNFRTQTKKLDKAISRITEPPLRSRDKWKFADYDYLKGGKSATAKKREYALNVELWSSGTFLAIKYATFLKNREILRNTNSHKASFFKFGM